MLRLIKLNLFYKNKLFLKVCCIESTRSVLTVREICISSSREVHAHLVRVLAHAQTIFSPYCHTPFRGL